MIKAYVWLHGQPLAQITPDGSVYYYHNDHLGTPQRITDASGTVVWAADYLPFGKADVTISTIENNLRFAGQYLDSETGLHYNYWRYYDPRIGRYMRADPIGMAGGVNLYAYAFNSPNNLIDPQGLGPFGIPWGFRLPGGRNPLGEEAAGFENAFKRILSNTGAAAADCIKCTAKCTLEWVMPSAAQGLIVAALHEAAVGVARKALKNAIPYYVFVDTAWTAYGIASCAGECVRDE